MFGGWFALIAVSYLVYRCAAANHRRRLLWVALLWVFTFATGMVTTLIAALSFELRGIQFATERETTEALLAPAGVGMLIGAVLCVWLVCRNPNRGDHQVM
jgi:hypothetical protein